MTTLETAETMIRNYGWSTARSMAEAYAAAGSPNGNLDGFWTKVLDYIDAWNKT